MTTEDKLKALEKVTAEVTKKYGKNSNIIRSTDDEILSIPRWKSSSPNLSYVCGGGYPKGRIIELFGPESSAKTSLSLKICSDIQKEGDLACFVDAEHSFDYEYAEKLGVDISSNKFRLVQPDYGEQALEIVDLLVTNKVFDVIVVDSVSALVPKAEIEGAMGDSHMGLQARLMGQAMRKITGKLADSGTLLVFINQLRTKIGIVWGSNETTSGGRALKFYSSIRLDVRKIDFIKNGDSITGIKVRVKGAKNKTGPPFRKAEIELDFEKGFNTTKEYLDLGITCGAIGKTGCWYSYGTEKIGQGRDNATNFLNENPDILKEVQSKVDQSILKTPEQDSKKSENKFKERGEKLKKQTNEKNKVPIRKPKKQ